MGKVRTPLACSMPEACVPLRLLRFLVRPHGARNVVFGIDPLDVLNAFQFWRAAGLIGSSVGVGALSSHSPRCLVDREDFGGDLFSFQVLIYLPEKLSQGPILKALLVSADGPVTYPAELVSSRACETAEDSLSFPNN